MIASTIGKTFIKAYNQEFGTTFTAKTFFAEVFFKLFYDDEKYFQWVQNSPFVQGIKKGQPPNAQERAEKLQRLVVKVEEGATDASVAIGYSSTDVLATTSGQVSNLAIHIDEEEVYASWIGGGLGIGVKGGFSFYINEPNILMALFDGWQYYRNYLTEIPKLRPNQIETWNGQWLAHTCNKRFFNSNNPTAGFDPFNTSKQGVVELATQTWVKVVFGLAQTFPNQQLLAYVFSLGQTNKTVGFIPILLPKVRKPIQLYKRLFGENRYWKDANIIEQIFGHKNSLYQACQLGAIGVRALEPRALRDLMWKPDKKINYKPNDDLQLVTFQTYITWILAMLNNEQLYDLAKEITQLFLRYESTSERGKMTKTRAIENLLKSKSPDLFLQELLSVVEEASPEEALKLADLVVEVNKLRNDNFRRFLTLLKLTYTIEKKQNS
ncbi:MAG: hypothetical protein AAF798_05100 [Bacteroidota bacterium]